MKDQIIGASDETAKQGAAHEQVCVAVGAARRTIAVLGDVWTLRVLRTVFRGKRRYGDFVAEFGVSRAVLTDRLGKLVEQGVLLMCPMADVYLHCFRLPDCRR